MHIRIIIFSSAVLLLAPVRLAAQPATAPSGPQGVIDIGLRATDISGDAARFQRFRDLGNGGFIDRFRLERQGSNWLFEVTADHVGRRDQRYTGHYRGQGKLKVSFVWDQIPLFISGDTRTLYTREAPGVLRIADSIQRDIESGRVRLADVVGGAAAFDTRSRRDTAAVNLVYSATRDLDLKIDFKTVRRDGTTPFGASFGFSNAVEVQAPIDTRTTDLGAAIE